MPHRLDYRGPRSPPGGGPDAPPPVNQIPGTVLANRLSTVSILTIVGGVWIGLHGAWCLTVLAWPVSLLCSSVALALAIHDTNRYRGSKSGPRAIWYSIGSFVVMGLMVLGLWLSRS
jgi:hypothetical protein